VSVKTGERHIDVMDKKVVLLSGERGPKLEPPLIGRLLPGLDRKAMKADIEAFRSTLAIFLQANDLELYGRDAYEFAADCARYALYKLNERPYA
jgi:hypothetical protein